MPAWPRSGRPGSLRRGARRASRCPPSRRLRPRVHEIVGLYLYPPEKAIVLCPAETSQIPALTRSAAIRPLPSGLSQRRTLDYLRHPTPTLSSLLELTTGREHSPVVPLPAVHEFLSFLARTGETPTRSASCTSCSRSSTATHTGPWAPSWRRTRAFGCTSLQTSAAWLNLVRIFFAPRAAGIQPVPAASPSVRIPWPPSLASSKAGTNAARRSPGPSRPLRPCQEPYARSLPERKASSGWDALPEDRTMVVCGADGRRGLRGGVCPMGGRGTGRNPTRLRVEGCRCLDIGELADGCGRLLGTLTKRFTAAPSAPTGIGPKLPTSSPRPSTPSNRLHPSASFPSILLSRRRAGPWRWRRPRSRPRRSRRRRSHRPRRGWWGRRQSSP